MVRTTLLQGTGDLDQTPRFIPLDKGIESPNSRGDLGLPPRAHPALLLGQTGGGGQVPERSLEHNTWPRLFPSAEPYMAKVRKFTNLLIKNTID